MRLPGFLQFTPHERKAILALLLFTGGGGLLIEAGRRFPAFFSGLRAADAVREKDTSETAGGGDSAGAPPGRDAGADPDSLRAGADSTRGNEPDPAAIAYSGLSGSPDREPPRPADRRAAAKKRPDTPIDVNRADEKTLTLLPGIGPRIASRIVAERRANGPFHNVDDLDRVKGIGPATLARLRPLITAG